MATEHRSRAERKEQTRRALLDGALRLASERGFAGVSLREVARSADIVPTAFYRHFESLDDLGLTLVDEATRAVRSSLRDSRRTGASANERLGVFIDHVRAQPELFRFVYRERYGGSPRVQRAIETELRLVAADISVDLSRLPNTATWDTDDLAMAADLIVSAMLGAIAGYLAAAAEDQPDVLAQTGKQLRLILVGVTGWRGLNSKPAQAG